MAELCCISLESMQPVPIPDAMLLCLGNFDGVHAAHRALLRAACAWRDAQFHQAATGVFCFDGLSSDVLLTDPPKHLCTHAERLERFAECGIEYAVVADFSELRSLSPQAYITEVLQQQCRCVAVACGYNHRFGKGGAGDPSLLRELLNGNLLMQEPLLQGGEPISSTRIRMLLEQGDVESAAMLLGQPYALRAEVLHGKALGRTIGTPTINQNFPQSAVIPHCGVYATDCVVGGKHYVGVSNVGRHPTVDADAPVNCETYLLNFSGDLYGQTVTVSFLCFMRQEIKFDSLAQLQQQIRQDASMAEQIVRRMNEHHI